MSKLKLDVRLDGFDAPIGLLVRDENAILSYQYSADYLASRVPVNLSLSMPVRQTPYGDAACRAFFGNVLQEQDDTISRVMDREGITRDDIAGLLLHLGKDSPGAISILAQGSPPAKIPGNFATDYEPLDDATVVRLIAALHQREPLPDHIADPSPLAGVQNKIALTKLPDGRFAQPLKGSGAPTTHILKVSNKNQPNETKLEALCMILSGAVGIGAHYLEGVLDVLNMMSR